MVVPGAVLPLTRVYEAARFVEMPLRSYIAYLKSPAIALLWAKTRLSSTRSVALRRTKLQRLAQKHGLQVEFDSQGDQACLHQLYLRDGLSPEYIAWRYFSRSGPKTLVFHDGGRNFVLVNIGVRRGMVVARLADNQLESGFLKHKLFPLLASSGVLVVMANSRYETEWPVFENAGMKRYNKELRAFVTRHLDPAKMRSASFSDLGLEAIKTEIV